MTITVLGVEHCSPPNKGAWLWQHVCLFMITQVIYLLSSNMPLTIEERIEVILLVENRSTREAADLFNQNHPEREPVSFSCIAKLLNKFKDTGSVPGKPRCGPLRRVSDEETSVAVLGAFSKSPTKSIHFEHFSNFQRTSLYIFHMF